MIHPYIIGASKVAVIIGCIFLGKCAYDKHQRSIGREKYIEKQHKLHKAQKAKRKEQMIELKKIYERNQQEQAGDKIDKVLKGIERS